MLHRRARIDGDEDSVLELEGHRGGLIGVLESVTVFGVGECIAQKSRQSIHLRNVEPIAIRKRLKTGLARAPAASSWRLKLALWKSGAIVDVFRISG